ncbi:MAG: ATPase, partial [Deltaproteobacteria bacterium]|nr:ATPase [Deltaproteobacteria bacterium]
MKKRLGDRLIENKLITEEQLHAALERQRIHGGRIGYNLLALNLISKEELSRFFKMSPPIPKTVEETGLEFSFITDLIMKHVLFMGEFTISKVSDRIKLSFPVVEKAIDMLRNERFLEVKSAAQLTKSTYQFAITEQGRNRSNGLLDLCRYIGPAPVTLEQYRRMVEMQTVKNLITNEESIKNAFSHLVVSDQI